MPHAALGTPALLGFALVCMLHVMSQGGEGAWQLTTCVVTCAECSSSGAQQGAVVVVLYAMLCVLLCMLSCYKHTLPARELRQVVMFMQGNACLRVVEP